MFTSLAATPGCLEQLENCHGDMIIAESGALGHRHYYCVQGSPEQPQLILERTVAPQQGGAPPPFFSIG